MDSPSKPEKATNKRDDLRILEAAARSVNHSEPQGHGPEPCTICLDSISERAVAVPCNHLTFDFLCLISWLQEQPNCPLCKATISAVQYDWRAPDDFKTYHVAARRQSTKQNTQSSRSSQTHSRATRNDRDDPRSYPPEVLDPALGRRREVYRNQLYSLHLGSNPVSRYQDFDAQGFAASAELQSRAKTFLRRELQVFPFLDSLTRCNDREFFLQYILAILRKYEVKGADGKAEDLVERFLGRENARLILHELQAWLRSPFASLAVWDRHVQYRAPGESHK